MNTLRFLLLGDIVGATGRTILQKHIKQLKQDYNANAIVVNGENSASDGRGIDVKIMHFFKNNYVDIVTSGNHIWAKKDIYQYLNENRDLLRPANFPSECPGVGVTTFQIGQFTVAVINLQGRTFMKEYVACPFKTADSILTYLRDKTRIIIVDFHAEATAEKMGLAYYLDGRISALVGTHTHVLTADERILPGGTAYITDLGMSGSLNSMIGMKKEPIIQSFITQMPVRFVIETEGPMILSGVCVEVNTLTGKAVKIEQVKVIDNNIKLSRDFE